MEYQTGWGRRVDDAGTGRVVRRRRACVERLRRVEAAVWSENKSTDWKGQWEEQWNDQCSVGVMELQRCGVQMRWQKSRQD